MMASSNPIVDIDQQSAAASDVPASKPIQFDQFKSPHEDFNRWWLILARPATKPRVRAFTREILAGTTSVLALVPEVVSFAFVAGVEPLVSLQAAWIVGLITALLGGAPGQISGAAGAIAVVMTEFVEENGVEFLFMAVIMMGFIQLLLGLINASSLIRLVGTPVMMGFVNGLAIIIFIAQLSLFEIPNEGWDVSTCDNGNDLANENGTSLRMLSGGGGGERNWLDSTTLGFQILVVAATMLVIHVLPKIKKLESFPGSLAGILVSLIVEFGIVRPAGYCTPTVADLASIDGGFPIPIWLDDNYDNIPSLGDANTWAVCLPLAFTISIIGLVESLMTAQLVGELTDRPPNERKETIALGFANVIAGIFGGMGGCGMIGQAMVNVKSGGVTRISSAWSSILLLIVIVAASGLINLIPVAALAGVMFMVCIHTFEWQTLWILVATVLPESYRTHPKLRVLKKVKRTDVLIVLVVTIVAVLINLAVAVGAGVVLCALVFSWEQSKTMKLNEVEFEPLLSDDEDYTHHTKDTDVKMADTGGAMAVRADTASSTSSFTALTKEDVKVYELKGPLFFASSQRFAQMFDYVNDPKHVELHFGKADACDYSALTAINSVARKYHSMGKKFRLRAVHETSMKAFRKAGQLMFLNDAKLGHEALASELIALSEVPQWTVRKGYKEETREDENNENSDKEEQERTEKTDGVSAASGTDQLDSC